MTQVIDITDTALARPTWVHRYSPLGDSREQAVPCRNCRAGTWNICGYCNTDCPCEPGVSGASGIVFDGMPTVRDDSGRSLGEAVRCWCGVMTWNVNWLCNGCQERE